MNDPAEKFDNLRVAIRGQKAALHKPLLLLYALGQLLRHKRHMLPYEEIDRELTELLATYGPPSKSIHTIYPFWRLQNDGVWVVEASGDLTSLDKTLDPRKTDLIAAQATGGFVQELFDAFSANQGLILKVAQNLATKYIAETERPKVLAAVGLTHG